MRRLLRPSVVLLAVLVTPGAARTARAQLVDTADASTLVQSTATDTDATFLALIKGVSAPQTLDYASTNTSTTWSSTLTGPYQGTGLSLGYSGDLTNYPGSAITWSTSGTYGASAWTGSGSATITSSGSNFSVAFQDQGAVAGHAFFLNYVIPGTVLGDGTIMFGDASNPEVGTGTFTVDSVAADIIYSYKKTPTGFSVSDIVVGGLAIPFYTTNFDAPPVPKNYMGTVTVVPEPSALALLAIGVLVARPALRRRGPGSSSPR